jgi:soluble lytic murein transglycosylase-like protein
MGPAGITAVTGRIAAIEQRFTPPAPTFRAALQTATAAAGSAGASVGTTPSGRTGFAAPAAASNPAGATAPTGGQMAGRWAQGLPPAGRAWAPSIERAALRAGIEPALLASLVWAESGFDAGVRSHAGAIGLAQLMPGTAAGLGVDPYDPQQNLDGGARYLAEQIDRFGRPELALAAYNAGPSRVASAGGIPQIAETQAYVPRVMGYYEQLRGVR